jgi:hypothetical protein
MMRELMAVSVLCLVLVAICGSGYSIASGQTIRMHGVEQGMADLYADYLRRDMDRQRAEFDSQIRNGLLQ